MECKEKGEEDKERGVAAEGVLQVMRGVFMEEVFKVVCGGLEGFVG